MFECYLTGNKIKNDKNDEGTNGSLEHIIPNSLGGQVKSKYILTDEANRFLNEDIDKEFNKIFTSWTSRLDLKRDRKKTQSFKAFNKDYGLDVFYRDGKFFPKKPFFDKDKKIIYAGSEKTGNDYKKNLIKNGDINQHDNILIYDDLAGSFHLPFGLVNTTFKRGLGKISAGYAAKCGISRKNMKCVIDLERNVIKDKIVVIPFLPSVTPEGVFEGSKHESPHYPIHSLVLYANKSSKLLYCYVELFSAFQFYVLLDNEYEGEDFYKDYVYDLIAGKEIDYKEYANSIPDNSNLFNHLPAYRKIDNGKLWQLTQVSKTDLKFYCHRNYHALEAFTNYYFINRKLKSFDADIA